MIITIENADSRFLNIIKNLSEFAPNIKISTKKDIYDNLEDDIKECEDKIKKGEVHPNIEEALKALNA